MKKTNTTKHDEAPVPQRMESLAALQVLTGAPLRCVVEIDAVPVEIPLRRMSASVEDEYHRIGNNVQPPPWDDQRKEYAMLNPDYLKRKDEAERAARAVMVYRCCPMLEAAKPGLREPQAILDFVHGALPALMLDVIAATIRNSGISLEVLSRSNFTSTPGLDD